MNKVPVLLLALTIVVSGCAQPTQLPEQSPVQPTLAAEKFEKVATQTPNSLIIYNEQLYSGGERGIRKLDRDNWKDLSGASYGLVHQYYFNQFMGRYT